MLKDVRKTKEQEMKTKTETGPLFWAIGTMPCAPERAGV